MQTSNSQCNPLPMKALQPSDFTNVLLHTITDDDLVFFITESELHLMVLAAY